MSLAISTSSFVGMFKKIYTINPSDKASHGEKKLE